MTFYGVRLLARPGHHHDHELEAAVAQQRRAQLPRRQHTQAETSLIASERGGPRRCFVNMAGHANQSEAFEAARQSVVLLVEDEILLRRTTAEYLRLSGFPVIEAPSAEEAIAVFASAKRVDVVFSDVYLSAAMDGLRLARWLHRHHPDIPVMLTSGYGDSARQAATNLVGVTSFLSKPYRQAEAVNRIRAMLDEARAETS
jgi:CheY-like chemotaxis protein